MPWSDFLQKDLTEYQSIPFWSWNDKLEEKHLREQIRGMKRAGIGGFFMHARGGLMTEYMGEDWMQAVAVCIDEAKKQGMDAWCYDENGWPSGFAGMKLLEDKANWEHYITFAEIEAFDDTALACYVLENGSVRRVYSGKAQYAVYDKLNSSVVDILNKDIVRKFLDATHEKYFARFAKEFGKTIKGFFTDEPQYFRWDTAYTPCILPIYRERYGSDLLDTLVALFVDCKESDLTRYRYWLLMNELYTENFAGTIYRWCEEHHCQLTGHSIEEMNLFGQMICCGGIMPFYEYEQKPGMDWLGRNIYTEAAPRQVSSVAQQLGKKHVLTETFACAGWDVTPQELKRIAEWQYVNGVNQMCQHLYPYSIRGQRKRDYPAFYSEHNPWTKDFAHFNDYFTALGTMLAESKEQAKVAVIHPIHSAYFTYKRNEPNCLDELNKKFEALIEKLGAAGIGHHYVDEHLLRKYGSVEEDALIMGNCRYEAVVIPDMQGIDGSTLKLLRTFVDNGGKIWLAGPCPTYVDGEKADVGLESNISFEDLIDDDIDILPKDTEVRSTLRRSENGDFLFAVNLSAKKTETVNWKIRANGLCLFDLETRTIKPVEFKKNGDYVLITHTMDPGESFVLLLGDYASMPENKVTKEISMDASSAEIIACDPNRLTIDYAQYSYDGVTFSKTMPIMAISDLLLRGKTNRKVYLRYTFRVTEMPEHIYLECEKMNAVKVSLNGTEIALPLKGTLDEVFVGADIANLVVIGENSVLFEIDYAQSQSVYDIFNGVYYEHSDGTESLINCLSYETDIEAIYLYGDFGVYATEPYRNGEKNTRITDGTFEIRNKQTFVDPTELQKAGYPFFAGSMTLRYTFDLTGLERFIKINGRYAIAKVKVNGKDTEFTMFKNTVPLEGLTVAGKNTIDITIECAYRNVLGLFHDTDPEPFAAGPDNFTRYGSWEDGKSPHWVDRYSFVHFSLDQISFLY